MKNINLGYLEFELLPAGDEDEKMCTVLEMKIRVMMATRVWVENESGESRGEGH